MAFGHLLASVLQCFSASVLQCFGAPVLSLLVIRDLLHHPTNFHQKVLAENPVLQCFGASVLQCFSASVLRCFCIELRVKVPAINSILIDHPDAHIEFHMILATFQKSSGFLQGDS